jgi:DNA ligase-1
LGYTKSKSKKAQDKRYKDMIGAIICQLPDKIVFKIGSGLTHYDRINLPKIAKAGSIITFKYKEFTKNGKPRFPVYLRVKTYK